MSESSVLSGFLLVVAILASGCNPGAELVARQIFSAPNSRPKQGFECSQAVQDVAKRAYADVFEVPVSSAILQVAIVERGEYEFSWHPKIDGGRVWADGPIRLDFTRDNRPPRGLILMLHGFGLCKEQMLPWAFEFASSGYRVATVDLRGHGASTGRWVGFGALEKKDLEKVLDAIESRSRWDNLPVGVLGVSYGASVGLDFAAQDPRVRAVVALEPFASARDAIPELARAAFPGVASRISDGLFQEALSVGARRALFNWSDADTVRSVSEIHYPILFIHGAADGWLSPEHSRRLLRLAAAGSRLFVVPGENHVSLPLEVGKLAPEIRTWFRAHLAGRADGLAATAPSRSSSAPM